MTFEGCCNRDLFEAGLSQSFIPQLEPGDVIILDNATFHKGETIREIVEEAGCELWYLSAYSPDLNKIEAERSLNTERLVSSTSSEHRLSGVEGSRGVENWWSLLKTWMKQMLPEFETVRECVDAAFNNCPKVFA